MMHAIIVGFSGAIAMNLTICKKQVDKQWRQQVVVKTVHKFSYLKRIYLKKISKIPNLENKGAELLYSLN